MHIIKEPENEQERQDALRLAGRIIAKALFPSAGYSPARAGRIIADAMIEEGASLMERDLSQECLSLIADATLQRLNQHYAVIHENAKLPKTIFGDDVTAEHSFTEEDIV